MNERKAYFQEYYKINKDKINERSAKYRKENPDIYSKASRKFKKNNPERYKEIQKKHRNTESYKQKTKIWDKAYYERNKLSRCFSASIRHSLKNTKNGKHWEEVVDYSLQDLREHLEKQFKTDMTWKNYGKWHIDHIKPISKYKITSYDCEDFKKCWSLTNLQPLWAKENQVKNNKWRSKESIKRNSKVLL